MPAKWHRNSWTGRRAFPYHSELSIIGPTSICKFSKPYNFQLLLPVWTAGKWGFQTGSHFCLPHISVESIKENYAGKIERWQRRISKYGLIPTKPHNLRKQFVDLTVDIAIEYYFVGAELLLLLLAHSRWLDVCNFYESHFYHSTFHVNSGNKKLNCSRNKMQILQMGFHQ